MTIVSAEWSTQKERDTVDEEDENDDEDDDYEDIDDEGESDRVEEINVGRGYLICSFLLRFSSIKRSETLMAMISGFILFALKISKHNFILNSRYSNIGNQVKGGNSVGILLSDLLACRELEEFEGEEEEDVKADPIHDIDICEYVSKSMLSVSQTQIAQVWLFSVSE